mgnify:FL=1
MSRRGAVIRICKMCGTEFKTVPAKTKGMLGSYCSRKCYAKARLKKIKRICLFCGKEFMAKRAKIKIGEAKYCSKKCNARSRIKEKHPNWKGGISNLPYHFSFDENLKDKVRKRDNYICQICGMTEEEHIIVYGRVLCVHHIDYNKINCQEDNLKTVCLGCNFRVNYNKEFWIEFFKKGEKNAVIQL